MDAARAAPAHPTPAPLTPAHLAKGALRRLSTSRQEPTPANFARAYAEEAGEPEPTGQGAAWAN